MEGVSMNEELKKLKRQMEYHVARAEVKIAQLGKELRELKAERTLDKTEGVG